MSDLINRLIHCGYSPSSAYSTCRSFLREFSIAELIEFITSLEEEINYVGRIQS
jgi:hypothetical protein